MNRLLPALLLIPVCALPFGVAFAADAPEDSDETESVAVVTAPVLPDEDESNSHLSLAGLGSLYWAAVHPTQAWRVLLPIQPGTVGYADTRARCLVFTNALTGEAAACPLIRGIPDEAEVTD